MKLSQKNLLYSLILGLSLLVLLAGYFVFMLPSLYVSHMQERHLYAVTRQQRAYLNDGNYENVAVENPVACFTLEVPFHENSVYLTAKGVHAALTPENEVLKGIFAEIRELSERFQQNETDIGSELEIYLADWRQRLSEDGELSESVRNLPIRVEVLESGALKNQFISIREHFYSMADGIYVWESSVEYGQNSYTNYMAMSLTDDSLVLSYLPVVSPDMKEITPVVIQSIPMLAAVLILLVLFFSGIYSGGIVRPITRLSMRTDAMREALSNRQCLPRISNAEKKVHGGVKTEIERLSAAIEDLYEELRDNQELLEKQNRLLAEENERQEVFLRASSHQLKTPIAAALLLVQGMTDKIGTYAERDVWLPQVKKQLLTMQYIVEEILYLNREGLEMAEEKTDILELMQAVLSLHDTQLREKRLQVKTHLPKQLTVMADKTMLKQILDNLIANAAAYSPAGAEIRITGDEESIMILNTGLRIEEEILPHLCEPFVGSGSGLGLYIASYYSKRMGMELTISNRRTEEGEDAVCAHLVFKKTDSLETGKDRKGEKTDVITD